ncbi:MAG: hypothetical protein DBX59_05165 [Bacillota bacterium]|nr:MAG: hypothetical protein DBX59_05165 [Bacillota bacterium]
MTNWNGWKITDEQAQAIKNGDITARNAFYMDNLERIRKMAYTYARNHPRCNGLAEDMIQGLFVDLAYFKQSNGRPVINGKSLSGFVYSSFIYAPYGGLLYCSKNNAKLLCDLETYSVDTFSLDKPFGVGDNRHQDEDNARTLAETIPAPDMLDTTDYTDKLKTLVSDFLTPRQREYFDLFADGYTNSVIAEKLGYKTVAGNSDLVRKRLRSHSAEILSRLSALGINVDKYKGKTPYDPKTERTYKLSAETRAYWAQKARERRARKKAVIFESALSN